MLQKNVRGISSNFTFELIVMLFCSLIDGPKYNIIIIIYIYIYTYVLQNEHCKM